MLLIVLVSFFFFFKQKTAYEMRISDWSSDVCSSDLIAGKLAALECAHDRIAIGQLAARGVDQIGTALEALERLVVDHVLGLRMERYVERDDVADAVHLLAAVVPGEAQFRL